MSQPGPPLQPVQQPVPSRAPGGRATLWCAPRGMPGQALRTALSGRLPIGQRLGMAALVVLVAGGGGAAAVAVDDPALAVLAWAAAFLACLALSRWALSRKRRSYGLVQVTPLQFDLVIALDQLPAQRIDAGRQLHDRLVWSLQQPTPDPVAVRQVEYWMWQLVTGA